MADAPSLNEILNIARDPGEGGTAPEIFTSQQGLVAAANQFFQNRAQQAHQRYAQFMDRLSGVYQQLGELQGLKVAQADRPYLEKEAGKIFQQISDDPHAFFSGKMGPIEQAIGKLRSQSTQSVQDNLFDEAHRAYIDRDPTLNTAENKAKMESYFRQPLGQRKPYTLDLPSLYNPQEIGAQINAIIPQKFSQTGLSPDGKFINTMSGIRYDEKQYKSLADQMYMANDARGASISAQVADRFKRLPDQIQDIYKNKYPDDPVKGFYDETVMPWRKPDQIEKTESKADPFAIQQMKNKAKRDEMAVKFGYDKVLEEMKLGGQKELARFRQQIKKSSKKEQVGALKGMIDNQIDEALSKPSTVKGDYSGRGELFELDVSPATLKIFSHTEGSGSNKKVALPDNLMVSKDGNNIRATFYQKDEDGNILKREDGEKLIDTAKTKNFSRAEYMARFGKDILGVSATEKEINANEDGDDEETESTSESTIITSGNKKLIPIPGF